MKTLVFMKKELLDACRSGRMLLLGILFVLFGIMNPAIAKLTPWMASLLADQLAEAGMYVGEVVIDARASWTQFFKNIPLALILYLLVCASIFTKEYQSGTLVLLLTKGLKRRQVVAAKAAVLLLGWSVGYLLCFGITYGYNAYFWDNAIMEHLAAAVFAWWLFGIFATALTVFFSTLAKNTSGVLLGTIGGVVVSYLLSLIPKLAPFTPTALMHVTDGSIKKAVMVTAAVSAILLASSVPLLNKKTV